MRIFFCIFTPEIFSFLKLICLHVKRIINLSESYIPAFLLTLNAINV